MLVTLNENLAVFNSSAKQNISLTTNALELPILTSDRQYNMPVAQRIVHMLHEFLCIAINSCVSDIQRNVRIVSIVLRYI